MMNSSKLNLSTMNLLLVGVLCFTLAAGSADLDLSNINVGDIQNQLPSDFSKTNLSIEDAKTLVRDKCIKEAGKVKGTAAFNDIESSTLVMAECVNNILNLTAIQEEIGIASPNGDLDVVFNKYCLKRPEAMECIEQFNSKLTPCLDEEERESQAVFMRIIKSILNFVCFKNGNQIALFIAEKGPECLESHRDDIQNCINSTFSGYIPAEGIENVKTLPKLVMGEKQCEDIEKLESCIVSKLETCKEITPANIVESLFRFIKNETICRSVSKTNKLTSGGAASTFGVSIALLLVFIQSLVFLNRKQIV